MIRGHRKEHKRDKNYAINHRSHLSAKETRNRSFRYRTEKQVERIGKRLGIRVE
jgi:hypothetical protein